MPVKKTKKTKVKPHLEIERKFVLKRFPKKVIEKYKSKTTVLHIIQYYFFIDGIWQRYRIVDNEKDFSKYGAGTKKTKYIHTIKESVSPGIYKELEKTVKESEFEKKRKENLKNYAVIRKTRYVIKHKGLKFEIDVYSDLSLVVLEVELPDLKHSFEYPEGLFEEIIIEVTGMKQFSNFNLAVKVKK